MRANVADPTVTASAIKWTAKAVAAMSVQGKEAVHWMPKMTPPS
jgi:hypothetical protein